MAGVTVELHPREDADIYIPIMIQDPAALELALDRYGGLAYAVALRAVRDAGRAEEVVQDVFLTLWKSPHSFDPSQGNFRAWLLTMVRNRSIDSWRSTRRHQGREAALPLDLSDTAPASDPARMAEVKIRRGLIREALNSLPQEQRIVIDLARAGYTHAEMAERLELPLGTIKGRLRLGMQKLRKHLLAEE